jgi:hypothetical protein
LEEIKRFRYHAATSALSFHFSLPFQEEIPAQASLCLKETGGFIHTRVDNFNFRDIVTFRCARAYAAGSFSHKDHAFDATASVTIEGLNILNIVTADRVTARVASSHPKSGEEPGITPIGSSIENLRIAGHLIEVDFAVDTFSKFRTFAQVREDMQRGGDCATLVTPADGHKESGITELSGTLVRSIKGLGPELELIGSDTIRIPGFGRITLGGIRITERKRTISMLQFELGSTPEGSGHVGGAEGNGSGN